MQNYLIVFHARLDPDHGAVDIGDDPCFDEPPTWGICRPNYRRVARVGANLFFLGYVAPGQYLMKGWFEVGQKISYVEAHDRFPMRANVVISPLTRDQDLAATIQQRPIQWRYPKKRQAFLNSGLHTVPDFLYMTHSGNRVFVQNPVDEHEIDNWKCNRIFHCWTKQFRQCMIQNSCEQEGKIGEQRYHNYVVAHQDHWIDVGPLLLPWTEIDNHFHLNLLLRMPKGQHNVRCIPNDKTSALIEYLTRAENGG